MTDEVLSRVTGLSFFAELSAEQLRALCAAGRPASYRAGERIFAEGDAADRFWLIETGSVALDLRVPGRGDQVIETLTGGSVLGWSWLHPPYRWQFGAVARERLDTIAFDGVAVRDRCAADPAFGYAVLRLFTPVITARLHAARLRLLDLYATPAQAGAAVSTSTVPAVAGSALPHPYRVTARRIDTADTVTLDLTQDGGPLAAFAPGQFAMLTAYGVGEVPISLSGLGDAGDGRARRLTHTLRAVGAVTRALHGAEPGAMIGVRGPFGTSWDVGSAAGHDVVVVAGGIGLAPVRPVLQAVLAERSRYGEVVLLVGARTPADLLYPAELRRWAAAGVQVAVTVDRPFDGWTGHVGVVPTLIADARFDPARSVAFVCGPEVMMRFTAQALLDRGLPADRLRVSLERNMRCGVGWCGHCQLGPLLLCRDGPVVDYTRAEPLLNVREL